MVNRKSLKAVLTLINQKSPLKSNGLHSFVVFSSDLVSQRLLDAAVLVTMLVSVPSSCNTENTNHHCYRHKYRIVQSLMVERFDEFDEWLTIHQIFPTTFSPNIYPVKPTINSSQFCVCYVYPSNFALHGNCHTANLWGQKHLHTYIHTFVCIHNHL